ncbi:hypothetical protein GCM10023156_22610 [Novipirellula rosea]|uniref:Uncharacterized protein n=1 Tax=Novipirellula rosea TaxID=1031540 RepID=A0ABP8MPZ0_9BACT
MRAINIERYACGRMRLVGSVIDRAAIKTLLLRDSTLHLLALDRLVSEGGSGGSDAGDSAMGNRNMGGSRHYSREQTA